MTEASCHCGAVRLVLENPPETLTQCNCSICRRYAPLTAYYSPARVAITGETDTYMWGDRQIRFHRCRNCGCFTHWSPVDASMDRMGVNARLMPPDVLARARIRKFDGADTWTFIGE